MDISPTVSNCVCWPLGFDRMADTRSRRWAQTEAPGVTYNLELTRGPLISAMLGRPPQKAFTSLVVGLIRTADVGDLSLRHR